jgi:hypothetical protein
MAYPSTITSFQYPTATSRLNNPSHSALENLQSSTIGQLEAVIGLADGGSVLGTVIGDLRSPNSTGGGHVQGAVFGGTGQTNFTKGDILVAQSASVLSKLAVGTDGQVLQAQSGQALGVQWSAVVANKVQINTNSITAARGAFSVATILGAASIAGSTLGTNGGIRFTGLVNNFNLGNGANVTFLANYGNNVVASIVIATVGGSVSGLRGKIEGFVLGNGNVSSQIGFINFNSFLPSINLINGGSQGYTLGNGAGSGNSSVNSQQAQTLTVTGQTSDTSGSILSSAFIVEKIV